MSAPRRGKYCPRCRTMTFVDRPVCETCGHGFRTGLDGAVADTAPAREPDALHKTMQFTLPPVLPRPGAPPKPPPATSERSGLASFVDFRLPKRLLGVSAALAILIGLIALGVVVRLRPHPGSAPAAPTPLGTWGSALAGGSASRMQLGFVFGPGGGGTFSWREEGSASTGPFPKPLSGQSPLRWRLNPAGRLALTIQRPPPADPVAGTMADIFNSHPWAWRMDRGHLILGNLTFRRE